MDSSPSSEILNWLAPSLLTLLAAFLTCGLGLHFWQLCQLGQFWSACTPATSSFLPAGFTGFLPDTLPGIVQSGDYTQTLLRHGILINGLIFIVAAALNKTSRDTSLALAGAAGLWNLTLIWDLSGWVLFQQSTSFLQLSNLFQIYPSAENLNTFLIQLSYLVSWSIMLFPCANGLKESQLYFHKDATNFIAVGLVSYGAFLVLNLATIAQQSPSNQPDWAFAMAWGSTFFFQTSIAFSLLGAIYSLLINRFNTENFSGLTYCHWFALFLGLALTFLVHPHNGFALQLDAKTKPFVLLALATIWLAFCYYGYSSMAQMKVVLSFSKIQFLTFQIALTLFNLSLITFILDLTPLLELTTSPADQKRPFWFWVVDQALPIAGLFLCLIILPWHRYTPSLPSVANRGGALEALRLIVLVLGFGLCVLAIATSLYYQQRILSSASEKGIVMDYLEMRDSLRPLLLFYAAGIALFLAVSGINLVQALLLWLRTSMTKAAAPKLVMPLDQSDKPKKTSVNGIIVKSMSNKDHKKQQPAERQHARQA